MRRVSILLLLSSLASCDEGRPREPLGLAPITNGAIATSATHPYAVFLELTSENGDSWRCSGTLIAPNIVLTAAHCTVCADSAEAHVLGEGSALEPGTKPLTAHQSSSVAFNPEAYPSPIDCSLPLDQVFEELNATTVWGADLGIVHLQTSSSVAPKPPLLDPPYGFNPVQDLFGQLVTVVGRGLPQLFGTDVEHMRYGTGSLDTWDIWNGLPAGNCVVDELDMSPFYLGMANETDDSSGLVESSILGGDSGGPMLATINGKERVIGVASASALFGYFSIHASVFSARNSAFVRGQLSQSAGVADADGDNVHDGADNCPGQANRDQLDRDGDGVGDLCDNCTPHDGPDGPDLLDHDGTPTSAFASFANPDQRNGNQEAEVDELLTYHPEYGSAVPSVTDVDYMLYVGWGVGNCDPDLVKRRFRYLRGDACDPIPTPLHETTTVDVTQDISQPVPPPLCDANGYAIGTCGWEMPSGFALESITQPDDDGTSGTVGLRFCECDGERDTAQERHQNCGAATTYNCAIDGSQFSSAGSAWKPLSTDPGLATVTFGPDRPEVSIEWDFLADLAAWTGVAIPPPPWTLDDDQIAGMPVVDGIIWSHVATYGGTPIEDITDHEYEREYAEIANWYRPADTSIRKVIHWNEIPQYEPALPWEYCGECGYVLPWLLILDEQLRAVIGVGPEVSEDVSSLLDEIAIRLLGGPDTRVAAAELEYQLKGTTLREVTVDAESLSVTGAIHVQGGQVAIKGETIGGNQGARARAAGPPAGSILTYSAVRDELYALAGSRAAVPLQIWTRAAGWQEMRLEGERVLNPVAATFRLEERALYALDRAETGAPMRLLRIDLDTAVTTVLDARLIEGAPTATSVSNGLDGGLLVAATFGSTTRLARLAITGGRVELRARADHAGGMTGDARETRAGIAFLVRRDATFNPRMVPASAFQPVRDGNPRPIFPR
jgi:hypothetical protein